VLLVLGNREARVFDVGFDRRDVQVDEGLFRTFPYKQFGPGDMIRRRNGKDEVAELC
jgi:hypothetical protein